MQSEEILRPLDDITVRGGVCNWYEVANAIFEVRRRLEAALSAAEPSVAVKRIEYTEAMGEAAQGYFNSFEYARIHTPGTFRFEKLWDVMQNAALPAQVQDVAGWLPIETAPKDGRTFLAVMAKAYSPRATLCKFEDGKFLSPSQGEKFVLPGWNQWWPTHWMPLPAAPAKQEVSP